MITTYEVQLPDRAVMRAADLRAARVLLEQHPGAEVTPIVRYTACPQHPAYEPANCPPCGTSAEVGQR